MINLPHVSTYEKRWVRRLMIGVNFPREIYFALKGVCVGAAYWWNQP